VEAQNVTGLTVNLVGTPTIVNGKSHIEKDQENVVPLKQKRTNFAEHFVIDYGKL
jgi:hypothetical protein